MNWELSDGTVVTLGGNVDGSSPAALQLTREAARTRAGAPEPIAVGVQPGGWRKLDLNDAQLVDIWVRTVAAENDERVVSAPDVEHDEDERDEDDSDESDDERRPIY